METGGEVCGGACSLMRTNLCLFSLLNRQNTGKFSTGALNRPNHTTRLTLFAPHFPILQTGNIQITSGKIIGKQGNNFTGSLI